MVSAAVAVVSALRSVQAIPADVLAARKIQAALDMFIDPPVELIADDCAMTVQEVEALVEKIHRQRMKTAARGGPKEVDIPAIEAAAKVERWRSAAEHPSPKVRKLHSRAMSVIASCEVAVETAIANCERAIDEWESTSSLRNRQRDLERELAEIRAQIAGKPALITCKHCPKRLTPKGMTRHVHHSHGNADQERAQNK